LRESAAVLELCTLFIGNDSGPKHMAAAMKTPVIEISCHPLTASADFEYSPSRFGAWGKDVRVVQPNYSRSPCSEGCRANEAHCILGVEPRRVIEEASVLLNQK
jgi:ADP-heptose:LPS heptosyltransferase